MEKIREIWYGLDVKTNSNDKSRVSRKVKEKMDKQ